MFFLNVVAPLLAISALSSANRDETEVLQDRSNSNPFALLTILLQDNPLLKVFENTIGGPILSCLESDEEALPALIHYLADNPSEIPSVISQVPADALSEIEKVGQEITAIPSELWAAITSFPSEAENIVTQIIAGHVPTQLEDMGDEIASDAEAFASKAKSFFGGIFGIGGDAATTNAPPPVPACLTQVSTTSSSVVVTPTAAPSYNAAGGPALTSAASTTVASWQSLTAFASVTTSTSAAFSESWAPSTCSTFMTSPQQSSAPNQTSQAAFGAGMLPLHAQGHWLGGIFVVMGLVVFL